MNPLAIKQPACFDDCLLSSFLKKLLHRSASPDTDTTCTVTPHLADVKEAIAALNTDHIPELSFDYLQATAQSIHAMRYAVVYQQGKPVLFAVFQLFHINAQSFQGSPGSGIAQRLASLLLRHAGLTAVISGTVLRNGMPCYCYDKALLTGTQAVKLFVSVAEHVAAEERAAALVLKDIAPGSRQREWLHGLGYSTPWQDKEMVLQTDPVWQTIDDYVACITRKYRARARKILEAGSALTVRALEADEIHRHSKHLAALFRQVTSSQQFVLTHLAAGHFSDMKRIYRDDFEVIGFFHGNELMGFYSAFLSTQAYELYYCGFDYERNATMQLYFNILYAGLARAIGLRKKQLKLGRTSFDAKASMGARPVALPYYFKSTLPQPVIKWFTRFFASMEDKKWEKREPLGVKVGMAKVGVSG